jgi:recombinase/resolvase-like protein/recombinase-like zinc beta ribbon protein
MTAKKTLGVYVRVSQVAGREGERFISPGEQVKAATLRAEKAGYDVRVFDRDAQGRGVSGATRFDDRPGMSQALKLIESGELAGLVVSAQDRLVRPERKYGDMLREFQERIRKASAVLLVADNPAAEVLDPEKELPVGFEALPTDVRGLFDRAVREEAGKRWEAARREAVARGVHPCAWVPVGYTRTITEYDKRGKPVNGPLAVDLGVAPVIVELFKLRAAGGSWTECARLLEERGVSNRKGEPYWAHSAVQRIVENRVYMGEARHGKFVNPEAHEAIIDPALWRAANPDSKAKGKRTRGSEGALLAGILRCSCCGRKMTPSLGDGRYRCRPRIIAGPPCEEPAAAQAKQVEQLVEELFLKHQLPWLLAPEATASADIAAVEREVATAKAVYENWLAADISDIDAAAFRHGLVERKARLEAAEDNLREAQEAAGQTQELATLQERWPEMTVPERRRWLHMFGLKVTVRRGREPVGKRVELVWGLWPRQRDAVVTF